MPKKNSITITEAVEETGLMLEEVPSVEEVELEEIPLMEEAPTSQEKVELIKEDKFKLDISVTAVFKVSPEALVEVENLGGGDLYVDTAPVKMVAGNLLTQGNIKTFQNVEQVYVKAASRPTVSVRQYK